MAVATAVAIGGLALSAAGTTGSFIQAGKQRKAQAKAQQAAAKAIDEAKKTLSINYMKGLGIQKEPYELQREAMLASGAQATEAARESERGAAAAAGRIQMAQNEAQAGIRTAMGQEMQDIDKLVANEEARLAGLRANISAQEAYGAQEAAAYAQNAANQAMSQGMAGLHSMGQQAQDFIKLYPDTGSKGDPKSYLRNTSEGKVSSRYRNYRPPSPSAGLVDWTNPPFMNFLNPVAPTQQPTAPPVNFFSPDGLKNYYYPNY
jgi:hypothetical protein